MAIQVELSTATGVKGLYAPRVEELCKEKLHKENQTGWVHLHMKPLKEKLRGIQKVHIDVRSSLNNKRIMATAEGFGVEPTVRDVLNKVSSQLAH